MHPANHEDSQQFSAEAIINIFKPYLMILHSGLCCLPILNDVLALSPFIQMVTWCCRPKITAGGHNSQDGSKGLVLARSGSLWNKTAMPMFTHCCSCPQQGTKVNTKLMSLAFTKREAVLSNEVKSKWEKTCLSCPFLRVWKSFPHSKTSLRPGREWTETWQAEVSGFLMAITCAVLTMFLTLLPQVSIATGKNQSSLNPCFHFLDMFWAIMVLTSLRQSRNVSKRESMILFLFLCIEYLNPKRLFAISSKLYSRINLNSLDLDTARCSNTLPRTSETTLQTISFSWPFSYHHNHQQKCTQCLSLRGYITTYIYKLLVIPPKALLKCFGPNRSLFSKSFLGFSFLFFWNKVK